MKRDSTSNRDMLRPWRRILGRADDASGSGEEAFRALAEVVFEGLALVEGGWISEANKAFASVFGYEQSAVVGRALPDLVAPESRGLVEKSLSLDLGEPYEVVGVKKDGTPLNLEVRASSYDGRAVHLIAVRVLTGKKRGEEALGESERRYADLLSNTRAYVYRCLNQPGWPNEFASDYALELTGYAPEDLLVGGTVRFGDLIVEEDRQRVWDEVQAALAGGERFKIRYTIRHRDGALRHVEEYGQGVYDADGNVEAIEGLLYDMTEIKLTEDRLREAEQRYRTLVEQVPAVTYIQTIGETSQSAYVSPQMETMLGYKPEECTSDPDHWVKIMHPADRERVLTEDARTNKTGEPFRMEYRQFARDGSVVWVRDEATMVRDEEGNPSYWLGVQYDMTERKKAEEALRESELRLRTVITNVPVVLFAIDRRGTITLSEGKGLDVLGLEPDEIVGRSISEVFGDNPGLLADVDRALGGEQFSAVREGPSWAFELWYSPLRASTGEVTGVIGVATDVTERRAAEQRLREAEARYRTLVEQIPAVVYIQELDHDGAITYISPQIEEITGYTAEEYVGEPDLWVRMTHPEDRERVLAEDARTDRTGEPFRAEYRKLTREGRVIWVRDEAALVRDVEGHPLYWQGIFTDITERREAEEVLRESEERYRLVTRATNEVIWDHDLTTNAQVWDGAIEEMFGYRPEEVGEDAEWWEERLHPEDRERVVSGVGEALGRGEETWSEEYRFLRADGGYVTIVDRAYVVWGEGGEPVRMLGSMTDVTERRAAVEAVRRSEARLAEAQRIARLGNWEWDLAADEVYWSDEVFRMYGFVPGSITPTFERLLEVVHADDRQLLKAAVDGALYRGEPYDFEHRIVRPDGEERVVQRRAEVTRDDTGKPLKLIGTVHDVTERKRAEEEIKEANRRLEELAVLKADFTAMVAHELDTPLAVIRGYADMLATGELDLAEQSRSLDRIQAETDLLEALVSDVRAAATVEREDFDIDPKHVPIGELFEDAARFAETLPGDHSLTVETEANGRVWADPYRVGQVLRNLLSNAAKYSPDGASIEVRARQGAEPGRVRIEVADRGTGIHPDDAARIFEKFGRGRDGAGRKVAGTGLGLYLSRRILQAHGSELTLDSEPGGGSVFGFELEAMA